MLLYAWNGPERFQRKTGGIGNQRNERPPSNASVKKTRKRKDRPMRGPCQRTQKAMQHEGDDDINCSCTLGMVSKGFKERLEELEIKGMKDHQLTLV